MAPPVEILAYGLMGALCVTGLGAIGAVGWLIGRLESLRQGGMSPAYLPDLSGGGSRFVILSWVWTGSYRPIGDPRLTSSVWVCPVLMVSFVLAGFGLVEVGQHVH